MHALYELRLTDKSFRSKVQKIQQLCGINSAFKKEKQAHNNEEKGEEGGTYLCACSNTDIHILFSLGGAVFLSLDVWRTCKKKK